MEKSREDGFDLLRVVAAFFVVMLHVSSPFVMYNKALLNELFWASNLYDSFCRTCVPIFIMLSGYFILKPVDSITAFYRKRLSRIAIPFLFWSVVYIVWSIFFDHIKPAKLWFNIFWVKPYFHLWFITMLIGLYLVSPLLADLRQRIGQPSFVKVAVAALLVGMLISLWNEYSNSKLSFALQWAPYVGYFMLGASLKYIEGFIPRRWLLPIFVVGSLTIFGFTGWLFSCKLFVWYFYDYLSVPVMVSAVALTLYFKLIKIKRTLLISRIAELSFGIYLFHAILLSIIGRFCKGVLLDNIYWHIPLMSLSVFILSTLVVWGMSKVPYLRRVVI